MVIIHIQKKENYKKKDGINRNKKWNLASY